MKSLEKKNFSLRHQELILLFFALFSRCYKQKSFQAKFKKHLSNELDQKFFRSSRSQMFVQIGVLKNFANSQENT